MRRLILLTCLVVIATAAPAFADLLTPSLTVDPSPTAVVVGDPVTVSGVLTVPQDRADASIVVSRSSDGVTFAPVSNSPVTTGATGAFSLSDTPPDPGTFTYKASWDGDSVTYGAGEATSGQVTVLPTAILTIEPDDTSSLVGQSVSVSGAITTSADTAGASVVVSRSSDGVTFTPLDDSPAAADGSGDFTLSDTAPGVGTYTYRAQWDGGGVAGPAAATSSTQLSVSRWTPELSIAASAKTITYGGSVKISGMWSSASGVAPTDPAITVTRVKAGNGTATPTTSLDGANAYKLSNTPPSAGTYTYTASWAGDATHTATRSGDVAVIVRKRATSLGLRVTHPTIAFGDSTRLVATLRHGDPGSKIWFEERVDGTWNTMDAVTVHANGVARLPVAPDAEQTYRAVFDANANLRASVSDTTTVHVRPVMVSKMIGKFHRVDGYAVYSCCTAYFYVKLKPSHAGKHWKATVQYFGNGKWRSLASSTYRFEKDGDSAIFLNAPTGYRYRVRARFEGDADHLPVMGAWSYFKFMQ